MAKDKKPPTDIPDLFTENFRHNDPPTSEAAFRAVQPGVKKNHIKFLVVLKTVGNSTASEMMEHVDMIYNSTWRRLSELKKAGLITNTEETRKNPRGYGEVVFVLTPEGSQYLEKMIRE